MPCEYANKIVVVELKPAMTAKEIAQRKDSTRQEQIERAASATSSTLLVSCRCKKILIVRVMVDLT